MGEQLVYNEKCVCGAEINMAESYDFISFEKLGQRFERWQQNHSHCLPQFIKIQAARLKQLEANNQKLLTGASDGRYEGGFSSEASRERTTTD